MDKKKAIFVFVLSSIISIIFTNKGQFWIRTNGIDIKNSSLQLLADKGLKGICLVGWLAILNLWQSKKVSTQNFVLLFLLGTMAQFPTAAPRYWVATYHLPLLLIGAKKTFEKHRHLFETSFSVLILVLFPIMSLFRYGLQIFSDKKTTLQSIYRLSFLGGDFDAYSSLCTTIDYVQTKGITWGKQLATVFLFFVPRSWWPGKSVGSGALVNDLPGSDFKNFSSPFIAEGYINFGFGGIVIFVVIISFLNKKYDSYNQSNLRQNDFLQMFYPAALALFFFLLRGDLLSSFAYSVGIFVAAWVCNKILLQKPSTIV